MQSQGIYAESALSRIHGDGKVDTEFSATDLLEQISADFDPGHFTLAEIKAEYGAVSSGGTPAYYDACLRLLEKDGLIAKNRDGSYYVCEQ